MWDDTGGAGRRGRARGALQHVRLSDLDPHRRRNREKIGAVIFLDALLLGLLLGGTGTEEGGPPLGLGTTAVAQLIQSYALIVTMRCIGLYYRHFKHRFPWSAE